MNKILIIEDQPATLKLFLECLNAKGFDTIGAENGLVGVKLVKQHSPDLIVCDIMMPQLDGYGVLDLLRQDPVAKTIPFIFVTAKVNRNEMRRGMALGADDYLPKPCTLTELLTAISTRLEKHTVLRQRFEAALEPASEPAADESAVSCSAPSIFPCVPNLSEVFDFIETNYQRPITLEDVAKAVGYSPSYLTNLTRRQTGKTVQRWIIERRMAAARSLLLKTDKVMEQIAAKVGYLNAVHFFRQFRQLHGTTPHAWRSANRH